MIAVISAGRPHNVGRMHDLLYPTGGEEVLWFVGEGETDAYRQAGATVCDEGKLVRSRNVALDVAFERGERCVQVSDDLRRLERVSWFRSSDKVEKEPTSLSWTLEEMEYELNDTGAKLAGTAPTNNAFFFPGRVVDTDKFIVADLIMVQPCRLRFDENFTLKEDYDYTAQHLEKFGKVARCNRILPTFSHRTNAGGAVAYRTEAEEQRNIARLRAKWGDWIQDNPRRPNEILLRYKPQGCLL